MSVLVALDAYSGGARSSSFLECSVSIRFFNIRLFYRVLSACIVNGKQLQTEGLILGTGVELKCWWISL